MRSKTPVLRRQWVVTDDQRRCPLACVWFAPAPFTAGSSDALDEAELFRPALLPWEQAFSRTIQLAA